VRVGWLLPFMFLAGCGSGDNVARPAGNSVGDQLDQLAIEKGLLPDPESLSFEGRYETRSELGTDKFCAIAEGKTFRVGFLSVYGPESKCEGQGTAEQSNGKVRISLSGKGECAFDADYDGVVLRFPGSVPQGCTAYCSPNASMSGTRYYSVDPGEDAARKTLGREIERLCR
jgi:hypothetical protein